MAGTSHRDLRVWQTAMEIATDCYSLAKRLPREELFGLTSQLRKAAASVPANIAEGHGRYTVKESIRYLNIANGSLVEVDTHLELAVRIGYLTSGDVAPIAEKARILGAMIGAFKSSLRKPKQPRQAPGSRRAVTDATTAP
jgi:four helix bundle protein